MLRSRLVPAALACSVLAATAFAVLLGRDAPGEREIEGHRAPSEPADWFYAQRMGADGDVPQALFTAALQQASFERTSPARADAAAGAAWQPEGPNNIGGRVTALAVAPGGTTLYLGAADGGVWKSTDSGAGWDNVTDAVGLASIGALALDPQDASTLWCGTGEANGSVDSYDGNGIWRSTDGGASWTSRGLAATARIARVAVDPTNSNVVLVAAMGRQFSTGPDRGLYRTTDGGGTWSKVLFVNDSTGAADIVINPAHPDTMYCSTWERVRRPSYRRASGPGSGIWRSTDRGVSWARLASGLPTPTDSVGRIALAVAPGRPSTVYASIGTGASLGYVGKGFYRSTDGGAHWGRRDSGGTFNSNFGGFCWYFGDIAVDPANPDHVWSLGVYLYNSYDGGVTWPSVNGVLHPDQHAIWIDPANSAHVYVGNDGGFWWTSSISNWSSSESLPISQFYDGDVDATNAANVFGGLQDNNTVMTQSGPDGWFATLGGDGFHVLVDPVDPDIVFEEYQYCCSGGGFRRSTAGGISPALTTGWTSSDRWGWDTPIAMNPANHNRLIAGSQFVYASSNNGVSWGVSSPNLTTNPVSSLVYGCCTTLAISAADTSLYYAGTDDAKVWRSTNRGASWQDVSAGLPGRWVTRVVPDPVNPQVVYVTESGFSADAGAALVFRSTDRGTTWQNISGNLPNAPADVLVVDPLDTQTLYLGTDLGVWVTRSLGANWVPLGSGLPLQAVVDLKLHAATRRLYAFTHGRSAWSLALGSPPAGVPGAAVVARLELSAPTPNPARSSVRMSLSLAAPARAEVVVYDVLGRRVSTLLEGARGAGNHALVWDGRDASGRRSAAGVYFVRATAGESSATRRVVLAD